MLQLPIRPWRMDIIRGVLSLSFAAVLIAVRMQAFLTLFHLIGVYFFADGVVDSHDVITGRRTSRRFWFDDIRLLLSRKRQSSVTIPALVDASADIPPIEQAR